MRRQVLSWFDRHGRDFPWRRTRDPFEVLIAEVLLHRTRSDVVSVVFEDFIRRYPDVGSLASAAPDEVQHALRPLGFSHRSARLPILAKEIVRRHGGEVPRSRAELLELPGVGNYIANAVLSVAFGDRVPLLDPNVIRLLGRVFGQSSARARPRDDPALWSFVAALLPRRRAREFNLGLVDVGAVLCLPRSPRCPECPLRSRCFAYRSEAEQFGEWPPGHS